MKTSPRQIWVVFKTLINSYLFSLLLLLVFVVGFWVIRGAIYSMNQERLKHKFETESKTIIVNIDDILTEYSDLLYTMRGLVMASEIVTRSEWKEYTDTLKLKEMYPSISALSLVRRIDGEGLQNFENKTQTDFTTEGIINKTFKVFPGGDRSEYYVVDYLEPQVGNEVAWGFDLYSEASRRKLIDLARDTNEVVMSEQITLVQEKNDLKSLLFMLPIYKRGTQSETLEERRKNITGVVSITVRIPDLLSSALGRNSFTNISGVEVLDLSTGSEKLVEARIDGGLLSELKSLPEVYKVRLIYGSKIWQLIFRSDKKVEVAGIDLLLPYLFLLIGILVTLFQRWQVSSILRSEERLANVIMGSRAGTWEWNVQTGETVFNERWAEIVGYTLKELEPVSIKTWEKLAIPEDVAKSDEKLNDYFAGKTDYYEFESRMRHKDGSIKWVADRGKLISRNRKGKPLKMMGIHLDITERKEAEEKLKKSREDILNLSRRNEAILFSIGDGLLVSDKEGQIVIFNKMAETLSEYTSNEAIGQHYAKITVLIDEKNGQPIADLVRESIDKGGPVSVLINTSLKRKGGDLLPVAVSAAPVKDINNSIIGCVVVFKDVSMQRSMDKAKTEFVMEASHHLRTPLSAINWYTQFLEDEKNGALTKEQLGLVSEIKKAGARMTDLSNALLNVARLEMGTFSVEPFLIKISEVISQSSDMFKPEILKKGLNYSEQMEAGEEMFMADPKLLGIIVQNLLSNAITYTREGGNVSLTIKKEDNEMKIIVSDNGVGIPIIDQGRIYERFYRADNVKQINPSGMGLGLFVTKQIVEQSGGNISFLSEEGKGTTFWVTYPLTGMKAINGNEVKTG